MTAFYAVSLVVGVAALLGWIAAVAVAETVPGWSHVDPDRRFGSAGRSLVGGVTGLGLGGMSSTFAGWPLLLAAAAAVGGALLVGVVALRLGGGHEGPAG